MSWLLAIGLKNTLLAVPFALAAFAAARWLKRPAVAHVLWALVLIKLLTPSLIDVPVGWSLNVEAWLTSVPATAMESPNQPAAVATTDAAPPAESQRARPASSPRLISRRVRQIRNRELNTSSKDLIAHSAAVPASWFSRLLRQIRSIPWLSVLGFGWLAGSASMAVLYLYRARRFRRFVRLATERDHELAARVGELAAEVGVGVPPRVIVVDGIVSPMLWGLGRNVRLVFPTRLVRRLSAAELDSLLLHELAHYARGDYYVRALELAANVLYWWNPLVWLARREIEAAEEQCCDDWVIEHQRGTRHTYAEALLTTIDFLCERPAVAPPAACGLGAVPLLKIRLTQIMRGATTAQLSRRLQVLLIVAGMLLSPLQPGLWATATQPLSTVSPPPTSVPADRPAIPTAPIRISAATPSPVATVAVSSQPFVPPSPLPPSNVPWGTAVAPNGQVRLEARLGRRAALINAATDFRVDLSAHQLTCVSFAPDSRTFASGHEDALARAWDSRSGGLIRSLHGAEAAITSIHISPDGRQVAAGTSAGHVLIWELATGEIVSRLVEFRQPVACLRWSPHGDRLAIAFGEWSNHQSATLVVWSPDENVLRLEQSLPQSAGAVEWQADDAVLVADWKGHAFVWRADGGEILSELQFDKNDVSAAAWSADCPLVKKDWANPTR